MRPDRNGFVLVRQKGERRLERLGGGGEDLDRWKGRGREWDVDVRQERVREERGYDTRGRGRKDRGG